MFLFMLEVDLENNFLNNFGINLEFVLCNGE